MRRHAPRVRRRVERLRRVGHLERDHADAVAVLEDELSDRVVGGERGGQDESDVPLLEHVRSQVSMPGFQAAIAGRGESERPRVIRRRLLGIADVELQMVDALDRAEILHRVPFARRSCSACRRALTGGYRNQKMPSRLQLRSKCLELVQNLNYRCPGGSRLTTENHCDDMDEGRASGADRRAGPSAARVPANQRARVHRGAGPAVQTVWAGLTEETAEARGTRGHSPLRDDRQTRGRRAGSALLRSRDARPSSAELHQALPRTDRADAGSARMSFPDRRVSTIC